MKRIAFAALAALMLAGLVLPSLATAQLEPTKYEFGSYFVVFATKGPNWKSQNTEEGMDVRMEIIENLGKVVDSGEAVIAGLVNDASDYEFIMIFQTEDESGLRKMLKNSKHVKSGFFKLEGHSWFAPVGLKLEPVLRKK